ncbi:MAG: hypothetical protein ACI89T_002569, partial [Cognaticolwellia sp.]
AYSRAITRLLKLDVNLQVFGSASNLLIVHK